MSFFEWVYLLGVVLSTIIRSQYGAQFRSSNIAIKGTEHPLVYVGIILWSIILILPFISMFTDWISFADYPAMTGLQVLGVLILVVGVWLLRATHADLGKNFSPSLFIRNQHQLITHGVYRKIRHPMYLSFLMWGLGQALLINNWLAGPLGIVAFVMIYCFRIEREEQQLLDVFGEQYSAYQKQSGRLLPKVGKWF